MKFRTSFVTLTAAAILFSSSVFAAPFDTKTPLKSYRKDKQEAYQEPGASPVDLSASLQKVEYIISMSLTGDVDRLTPDSLLSLRTGIVRNLPAWKAVYPIDSPPCEMDPVQSLYRMTVEVLKALCIFLKLQL